MKVLGLTGMGGIGKTTLATALFDRLSDASTSSCFVTDIRSAIPAPHGARHLQHKLLKDLADDHEVPHDCVESVCPPPDASAAACLREIMLAITSGYHLQYDDLFGRIRTVALATTVRCLCAGRQQLRHWLSGRKVLIVLDDIEDGNVHELLDVAAGPPRLTSLGEHFTAASMVWAQYSTSFKCSRRFAGPGSVVIMTSRDQRTLRLSACQHVELVEVLDSAWARDLFYSNVDISSIPSDVTNQTVAQIIDLCSGLPLSLKVLCRCLHGTLAHILRDDPTDTS